MQDRLREQNLCELCLKVLHHRLVLLGIDIGQVRGKVMVVNLEFYFYRVEYVSCGGRAGGGLGTRRAA